MQQSNEIVIIISLFRIRKLNSEILNYLPQLVSGWARIQSLRDLIPGLIPEPLCFGIKWATSLRCSPAPHVCWEKENSYSISPQYLFCKMRIVIPINSILVKISNILKGNCGVLNKWGPVPSSWPWREKSLTLGRGASVLQPQLLSPGSPHLGNPLQASSKGAHSPGFKTLA